jgi:hypothetical protein
MSQWARQVRARSGSSGGYRVQVTMASVGLYRK